MDFLKVALLAPLLFLFLGVSGQSYFDMGSYEYSTPVFHYDSIQSEFTALASKAPDSITLYLRESQLYRVNFDTSLQSWDSTRMTVPENGNQFYTLFREVPGQPGWVLALRHDINLPGSAFVLPPSFKGNCDICRVSRDSLYNCMALMPDSAYAPFVSGVYREPQGDTVYMIMRWSLGSQDTTISKYIVKFNLVDLSVNVKQLNLSRNGMNFEPVNDPLQLSNGQWMVRAVMSDSNTTGYRIIRVNNSWDSIVAEPLGFFAFEPFSYNKFWNFGDKVVFYSSGYDLPPNWSPSDPIYEKLQLIIYDLQNDSISKRFLFDFSADTNDPDHHISNYAAHFDGEHFVVAGNRQPDWLGIQGQDAMVLAVIDTNFQLKHSLVIEDTTGAFFQGIITGIIPKGRKKEYYYYGSLANPTLTGGGFDRDLMLGKLDLAAIGLDEQINIRKQEIWLYPNPATDYVRLDNFPGQVAQLRIYDQQGRELRNEEVNLSERFNVSSLKTGVYIFVVTTEEGERYSSVVKKR